MKYKTYQQGYTENYRCYFRGLTNYYPWLCSLRYSDSLWTWVCYCESTLLRNSVLHCVTQEEPSWWFDKTCLKDGSGSDLFFPFTHSSEDLAKDKMRFYNHPYLVWPGNERTMLNCEGHCVYSFCTKAHTFTFFPEWKWEWVPMTPAFCSTQKQYIFKCLQFAELP